MSEKRSYFWPCFFLYLIWLNSCSIARDMRSIKENLQSMHAGEK